jgi:hypothetical protein
MTQRRPVTLISVAQNTSTTAVGCANTDFRFDESNFNYTLYGFITSGQQIAIYSYPDANHTVEFQHEIVSSKSSAFCTATNSFYRVIQGPVYSIEARTVGSGAAQVVVLL